MSLKKGGGPMSNRSEFLKTYIAKDYSTDLLQEITRNMRGMTDNQKEKLASQLLSILKTTETESQLLKELQEKHLLNVIES